MNVTYASEHLKPRVSDRFQAGAAALASSRGGADVKCGDGASSYSMRTLQGNWNEERFDSRNLQPAPVIQTDLQHVWKTSTQLQLASSASAHAAPVATAADLYARAQHIESVLSAGPQAAAGWTGTATAVTQQTMLDIVDGRARAYPGHQPEQELPPKKNSAGYLPSSSNTAFATEIKDNYTPPVERLQRTQVNAPDLYSGPAGDKVGYVIFKIRLLMHQKDAPPSEQSVYAQRVTKQMAITMCKQRNVNVTSGGKRDVSAATFTVAYLRRQLQAAEATPTVGGIAKGDGMLNFAELKAGLTQLCGLDLDDDEIQALHRHFDKDRKGEVPIAQVVKAIRGDMNSRREAVVRRAFDLLSEVVRNKTGSPVVRFKHILDHFDAAQHPSVLSGVASADQIVRCQFEDFFAAPIEKQTAWLDGLVEFEQFREVYADHSASIEADYAFEKAVRNTWHVSGGDGAAANSSCRRVTVVHTNGRVTKETILNDLGVAETDMAAMLTNLQAQGVKDVKRILLNA